MEVTEELKKLLASSYKTIPVLREFICESSGGDKLLNLYSYKGSNVVNLIFWCHVHGGQYRDADGNPILIRWRHFQGGRRCACSNTRERIRGFDDAVARIEELGFLVLSDKPSKFSSINTLIAIACPHEHMFSVTYALFKSRVREKRDPCDGCRESSESLKRRNQFVKKALDLSRKSGRDIYDYSRITNYTNQYAKVEIYCNSCEKSFWQTPEVHLNGGQCTHCRGCSAGEQAVAKVLDKMRIAYEREKCVFGRKRFDFYLPELNAFIEFDGQQHFRAIEFWGGEEGFRKQLDSDAQKNNYCRHKHALLRIPYQDLFNVGAIIRSFVWNIRRFRVVNYDCDDFVGPSSEYYEGMRMLAEETDDHMAKAWIDLYEELYLKY
jgi:very-short-patch-repair endonuclease